MRDVNFVFETEGFNFRVGAYITCGEFVLLQKGGGSDFFNLVGGRVHLGENTVDAIKREVKEELGIDIKNPKLMVVAENFFKWQGKDAHEMLFIYHVKFPKTFLKKFEGFRILDQNETSSWFEKSKLKQANCLPRLIYKLPEIEEKGTMVHVIGN